ncbi:MAG: hypothetical protein RBR05_04155 [Candidatus Methanomethylophilaceae archaeon]|nr:hypothetical protein [Candidatus Methanomethylophilaceae archaeon]
MYKKSINNLISDTKPCESYDIMSERVLKMPMADETCDKCGRCVAVCSGHAIFIDVDWSIDLGKCIFCRDCYDLCKHITPITAPNYVLKRNDLIFSVSKHPEPISPKLSNEKTKTLKRSVSIRELDTGSCNACEIEINAMDNKYYDMERFGLKIVPSPRHADVILVTGPMTKNMLIASKKTYAATPDDKLIIACGTCAISGGLFIKGDVVGEGISDTLPVDMYIVGCPPSPNRIVVSMIDAMGLRHK